MTVAMHLFIAIILFWAVMELRRVRREMGLRAWVFFLTAVIALFLLYLISEVYKDANVHVINDLTDLALFILLWAGVETAAFVGLERLREQGELHRANIYQRIFYKKYLKKYLRTR